MGSIRLDPFWSHVSNAFVEIAPNTLVGTFYYVFTEENQGPIYIRPGPLNTQDVLDPLGAEWLLYSRSVLSYRIEVEDDFDLGPGGASLVVELGDDETAGVPDLRDWAPFHLAAGDILQSSGSGIELPGLIARFRIRPGVPDYLMIVRGSIIVRGI